MKKIFFPKLLSLKITGCILFSMSLYFDMAAQSLAINTTGATAHPSALLDVSSLNKGMLIPRIGLTDVTDVTTIPAPATSLMVYNTNATITGGSGTGFYFYTGSSWVKMTDGSTPLTGWSTTGNGGTIAGTNFVGTTDPADLVFKTNGAENMRILNATGRVAINTPTATRLFQVNGDSRFQNNTYLDNNFFHYASNFGNTIFYKIAGMNNVNELTFGDNSFPNILTRFYLGGTASTNGLNFQSPAFPNLLYMDGLNGRVGIGTGTPAHRLELSTDDAAKPGTGTWTVVSDIRMKQNIRPYTEGLSKLLQVEPVEYNYNTISGYDTKPSYVGVVAQDLQKIAPYMVGQFKKNGQEYLDINTSAMTYMMINAIKEQQKMIGELKNEIEALKKK